jgi:hypothetical protein
MVERDEQWMCVRRLRPDAATSHRVSLCVYAAGDCGGVFAIGVVAWIFCVLSYGYAIIRLDFVSRPNNS